MPDIRLQFRHETYDGERRLFAACLARHARPAISPTHHPLGSPAKNRPSAGIASTTGAGAAGGAMSPLPKTQAERAAAAAAAAAAGGTLPVKTQPLPQQPSPQQQNQEQKQLSPPTKPPAALPPAPAPPVSAHAAACEAAGIGGLFGPSPTGL